MLFFFSHLCLHWCFSLKEKREIYTWSNLFFLHDLHSDSPPPLLFYLFIFLTGPLWKMLSPLPFQRAVNEHNGEGTNIILAINTAFGTKWNILKGRLHLKPCSLVHFPKIVGKINYIISRSLNNLWVEVHRLSQISQTALSFR